MRTIKFRAKPHPAYYFPDSNTDNLDVRDGFIFGAPDVREMDIPNHEKIDNLYYIPTCFVTLNKNGWLISTPVIEDTIGEFTGIRDRHGKEIYEGDIITFTKGQKKVDGVWVDDKETRTVSYSGGRFSICDLSLVEDALEIIGNIYDNGKRNE